MANIIVAESAFKWLIRIALLLSLVASNGPLSSTGFHHASLVGIEVVQARTFRRRSAASFKKACDNLTHSLLHAYHAARHFVTSMLLYEVVIRLQLGNSCERVASPQLLRPLFHPPYYSNANPDEPFDQGISRG